MNRTSRGILTKALKYRTEKMFPSAQTDKCKWIFAHIFCLHLFHFCGGEIRHSDALFKFIPVPKGKYVMKGAEGGLTGQEIQFLMGFQFDLKIEKVLTG